ncbi:MAG TPA: DUF3106 domain-containing protein [Rhodocyclaceae bacterium]|nr:DUF3106 domain-containing protein [Rhodocyclaceae bacterium]
MKIGRYVVAALWIGAGAVVGVARADIRPLPVQATRQPTHEEVPFAVPDRLARGRHELLAQWNTLPPEQRQQMRQQMREHWQQMPPEQRQERRERWQQMPSEERQRIREEMRERGGGYGDGPFRGGPGGRR